MRAAIFDIYILVFEYLMYAYFCIRDVFGSLPLKNPPFTFMKNVHTKIEKIILVLLGFQTQSYLSLSGKCVNQLI